MRSIRGRIFHRRTPTGEVLKLSNVGGVTNLLSTSFKPKTHSGDILEEIGLFEGSWFQQSVMSDQIFIANENQSPLVWDPLRGRMDVFLHALREVLGSGLSFLSQGASNGCSIVNT